MKSLLKLLIIIKFIIQKLSQKDSTYKEIIYAKIYNRYNYFSKMSQIIQLKVYKNSKLI